MNVIHRSEIDLFLAEHKVIMDVIDRADLSEMENLFEKLKSQENDMTLLKD